MAEASVEKECIICRDPLVCVAVLQCNHKQVCPTCIMRLRVYENDKNCVYCKAISEKVFVTDDFDDNYETFDAWDGANLSVKKYQDCEIYFKNTSKVDKIYSKIQNLRLFKCNLQSCPEKDKNQGSIKNLKKHLVALHKKYLCDLCLNSRNLFVGELQRFSKSELANHLTKGSPLEGLHPHPKCTHCTDAKNGIYKRFYDNDALYSHLKDAHEQCHICFKQGDRYYFLRDRHSLIDHYKEKHFLCEQPTCAGLLVAFGSELDYRQHMTNAHPLL